MTVAIDELCLPIITNPICWKAGMDEDIIYAMKDEDSNGIISILDLNGYSYSLEVRVKATDAATVLTKAAILDLVDGLILFEITDIETLALLTKTRKNYYVYRVIETQPDGQMTILAEARLTVIL